MRARSRIFYIEIIGCREGFRQRGFAALPGTQDGRDAEMGEVVLNLRESIFWIIIEISKANFEFSMKN